MINSRLAGIQPSLIRAISAKRKPGSIDLGLGEPTLKPSIAPFEKATAWVAANGVPYTANAGDPHLRDAISKYYAYPGMNEARNVCVTTGSQEALYCAIGALLEPGVDEVLVVEPVFGAYAKVAELLQLDVRRVAMSADDGFAFDIPHILQAVTPRTRMLVICSPCNPTGRVLRQPEAEELAAGLLARAGDPVIVLFDEVYRELAYVEDAADFAKFYPHTVAVNSLSKSNALTGLRVGWAIGAAEYIDYIVRYHAWATSVASTFAQRVALEILTEDGGRAVREHSAWYARRARDVRELLEKYGLRSTPLEGTFYTLVEAPGIKDSVAAAIAFADEDDVLTVPGRAFGDSAEGRLRLSLVAPLERIDRGLHLLKERFLP